MSGKKDLAGALRAQEEEPRRAIPEQPAANEGKASKVKPAGREGMVNIAVWFPMIVKFELEELRLARSRQLGRKVTFQELQAEAYNDLFKKYGRPEVAPKR